MQGLRPVRLIQICHEIKTNPNRTPKELYKALGVSKQQFYKDKRLLERLGFRFTYSPKKKSFTIEQDSLINIYDLTLSEIFALVMSVRQFSSIVPLL
jgi:predicted DNA-binding transcriptional regulator YafY